MSFLPDDYEVPQKKGYFKPVQGRNVVRFLGSPIIGTVGWLTKEGKRSPVRVRPGELLPKGADDAKHFWAGPVFVSSPDEESGIRIWEITQVGIQNKILELSRDPNWGDPKEYDLVVTRKGMGLDTEYRVIS